MPMARQACVEMGVGSSESCIAIGIIGTKTNFNAYDGAHEAELQNNGNVRLKMNRVTEVKNWERFIHQHRFSSPYSVSENVKDFPVFNEGRKIRYSEEFKPDGVNATCLKLLGGNQIYVRTMNEE